MSRQWGHGFSKGVIQKGCFKHIQAMDRSDYVLPCDEFIKSCCWEVEGKESVMLTDELRKLTGISNASDLIRRLRALILRDKIKEAADVTPK